jgi:hypothetical protein
MYAQTVQSVRPVESTERSGNNSAGFAPIVFCSSVPRNDVLRAANRYACPGCGSTACSLFYLGSELILIDIRNLVGRVPVSYDIAGPCSAEPLQLVPTQLSLSLAGPYQLRCTSLRIATETRPVRNTMGPFPSSQNGSWP